MRIPTLLVTVGMLLGPIEAGADAVGFIAVERSEGAEPCPGADTIGERIAQIRGRRSEPGGGRYRIAFTRKVGGFVATIRTEPATSNVRTLEHDGAQCSPLADAVAVTLALLLDSEDDAQSEPEPPPRVAPADDAPPSAATRVADIPLARDATIAVAATGLAGVLRPLTPALSVDVGARVCAFRVSGGALWAWPAEMYFGPGRVGQRLASGVARACFAPWQDGGMRFDVCSGVQIGRVLGEGDGYTRNERHARPWVALPLEVALAGWTRPIGWEVAVAGLLPIERPDFLVEGLGVAYESPPMGAMLSVRAFGIVPW